MPLILAIEPDKRQSSQLASLVKGLHAELVQGGSAADGLKALHGRVPDLVLTTSLISPRDDAALAAHLRELGIAASHVQTVTIPLLGTAAPTRAKGGMLAAWRRERPQAPMTDGCAPDVFAEQIRQYLATAEEQKAATATRLTAVHDPAVEAGIEATPVRDEAPAPIEACGANEECARPEPEPEIEIEPAIAPAIEASAPQALHAELEPIAQYEPVVQCEPAAALEPVIEAAPLVEIEAVAEPEQLVADEPTGLPLSQLLQLVTASAPIEDAAPVAEPEPVIEPEAVFEAKPVFEPEAVVEFEPALAAEPAMASEPIVEPPLIAEPEPVAEIEPAAAAAGSFDELFVDPVAAQALDELSRQAAQASLGDGIPAEVPVPVVEMRSFESLDSIANELAAGPSPRYESLDDLASLFAATPATHEATPLAPAAHEFIALPQNDDQFASLFARPVAPSRVEAPIEVPGIDESLFASAPVLREPAPVVEPAAELEQLFAAVPEPEPEPEPEIVMAAAPEPEPVIDTTPEPVFVSAPEPVVTAAPQPVVEIASEPDPAPEPELVVAAAPEPEPIVEEPSISVEAVVFEPVDEEPQPVAAAPTFEEEIALDVDSFAFTPPDPPAEPARFAFTLVEEGFGDAWSDFEVPAIEAIAADLGVGEHAPLDPYAAAPRPATVARERLIEPAAAPALDDEALSLIGDAARKASLDALVVEEFERGLSARRQKKTKKKAHAGATQVPPAPPRDAKPGKRPVQDEWGMFDPEQCGFAALDEEEGENKPTSGTRVRVISY
jgi:hypothetical protein